MRSDLAKAVKGKAPTFIGHCVAVSELATVWTDPDFDLNVKAFYYTRVLEIPTPRWVLYDKVTHGPLFGLPFRL